MALRLIDGVPGAGKTYFAVQHALHSFYRWNDELDCWVPKDSETVLVSNIDSLKIGVQLSQELEAVEGSNEEEKIAAYFNYEFLEKRFDGKRVVFILDEAQGIFHYRYFSKTVFLYFQKHRHLGHDVYLVTQDVGHLAKGLRNLAEYHICAAKRSMSFLGEFRYRFVDPTSGQCWKTKVLKRDQKVFAVYRSMVAGESEKLPSVPRRYAYLIIILCVAIGIGFKFFMKTFFPGAAAAQSTQDVGTKKGGTPGKGQPPIVTPKGNVDVSSSSLASKFFDTAVSAVVVGTFEVDGRRTFLVDLPSASIRLGEDDLTRLCKCHADLIIAGLPFDFYSTATSKDTGAGRSGLSRPSAPSVSR